MIYCTIPTTQEIAHSCIAHFHVPYIATYTRGQSGEVIYLLFIALVCVYVCMGILHGKIVASLRLKL